MDDLLQQGPVIRPVWQKGPMQQSVRETMVTATVEVAHMELIQDYMRDDVLRHKLNTLTQKVFNFDFEDWVTGGYFEGDYIPFSFVEDGEVVANASVNRMDFMQNEVRRNYLQIGTVMTDVSHRRQGLARRLMEHIFEEYENKCDGIYLFGDLQALDFYRKLGLQESVEYLYVLKQDCVQGEKTGSPFCRFSRNDERMKRKYMEAVRNSAVNAALEQVNKFGLQMFYTSDLRDVFYSEDMDCFAVLEKADDTIVLKSIVSQHRIPMQDVISRIDVEYSGLRLGFPPLAEDADMFDVHVYDGGDNYRLFYRGKDLKSIEKEKLCFPLLSHA